MQRACLSTFVRRLLSFFSSDRKQFCNRMMEKSEMKTLKMSYKHSLLSQINIYHHHIRRGGQELRITGKKS
ncbi:hypothetical protein L3Y34_012335 [Caenorhabditis briggsae]|uniref:Uncharacterized protein n=1 Tax=Caenorhabditis briggsae TaxID=6238 RepID=A0AAE8ZNY1_CAEBR|nr:hypothetical protein L3Y34_012335 [Caenorhabditis briggsae]